ncbi:MAG: hypothetical protein RIQ96_889 [Pseudomonadota bacterium]
MFSSQRILVPVDGSESSNKALVAALQIARDGGGRVRLLHSLDELSYLSGYEYSALVLQQARDHAARVLAEATAVAASAGVPCDTALRDAPGQRIGEVVANEARSWDADLIVLGSHGRRGLQRVLMGSGAEQIVREAPVPVMVVPALSRMRPPLPELPPEPAFSTAS